MLERHGPAVLRVCVARLGRDRGEEAFQETMLAALRHNDGLRDIGTVGGWLFSIAQHKIIDNARSDTRPDRERPARGVRPRVPRPESRRQCVVARGCG